MKKTIISIILSTMILTIPTFVGATSTFPNINEMDYLSLNDIPDWATGNFIGLVGITSNFGNPGPYNGYIAGYYENEGFKGKFVGALAKEDTNDLSGFIGGYLGGPFLIGILTNSSADKMFPIVGIGASNETHFYYRIMGLVGPTMYIAGRYQSI